MVKSMEPLSGKKSDLGVEQPGKLSSQGLKEPKEAKPPKFHRRGQITLPDETRHKLAELTREYLNEELTEKGFKLRKGKILAMFAHESAFCHISDTKKLLLEAVANTDHLEGSSKELTFHKNDIITVLERLPNGTFKGECEGVIGFISDANVKFLDVPAWVAKAKAKAKTRSEGEMEYSPDYTEPPPYGTDTGKKKKEKSKHSDLDEEERKRKEEKKRKKRSQAIDPGAVSSVAASADTHRSFTPLHHQSSLPLPSSSASSSATPSHHRSASPVSASTAANASAAGSLSNFAFTFTPNVPMPMNKSASLPVQLSTKLSISDLRESAPQEKPKLRGKGSDENMQQRSEFMPPFPETNLRALQSLPEEEDKVYISGYLLKKNDRLTGWRKARNRAWKAYWVVLMGTEMRFFEGEQKKFDNPFGVISILEATVTHTYTKKKHVFVLAKKDQSQYLFQAKSDEEMKAWEDAIQASVKAFAAKFSSVQFMLPFDHTEIPRETQPMISAASTSSAHTGTVRKTFAHDAQQAFQDGKYAIKAVAIRDHVAESDKDLSFLQGEVITVIESRGNGLFFGRCEGNEGLFRGKDVVFQGRNAALVLDEKAPKQVVEAPKLTQNLPNTPVRQFLTNKYNPGQDAPQLSLSTKEAPQTQPSTSGPPSPTMPSPVTPEMTHQRKPSGGKSKNKDLQVPEKKEGKDGKEEKPTKRSSKGPEQRDQLLNEMRKKRKKSLEKLRTLLSNEDAEKRYKKLERVGKGSFGFVFKGLDEQTGKFVAIKTVDLRDTIEDLEIIQQEIAFMTQLDSPYVTQYYGSYVVGNELWIIMDYLGGGSVYDIVIHEHFQEKHIAVVTREVLKGLKYLHSQRKLHRDIKAANILLADDGTVKLCDFGVAGQLTDSMTRKNTFIGTPSWMAPEVITNSGYDMRADIWSLGITIIEMATGFPPNANMHPMRVLYTIAKEPPPVLSGAKYSFEIKDFVSRCLKKDPKERPTAEELLEHPFLKNAESTKILVDRIKKHQAWLLVNADNDDSSNDSEVEDDSWDFDV